MKRLLLIITLSLATICTYALQPQRGYRTFVDWNNYLDLNIGFIAGEPGDSKVFTGFTTSHGYQFNSWLYVGGGTGFQYNLDWKKYGNNDGDCRFIIPVFAEARLDARWHRFTPYFSLQLGTQIGHKLRPRSLNLWPASFLSRAYRPARRRNHRRTRNPLSGHGCKVYSTPRLRVSAALTVNQL